MAAALLLVACAWSTHVSPVHWPWLSSFALTFPAYLAANMFFLGLWLVFRWRHALISLAALVLSWGSVRAYFPVNVPNPHPKDCIKVMTYNVWGFAENDHRCVHRRVFLSDQFLFVNDRQTDFVMTADTVQFMAAAVRAMDDKSTVHIRIVDGDPVRIPVFGQQRQYAVTAVMNDLPDLFFS